MIEDPLASRKGTLRQEELLTTYLRNPKGEIIQEKSYIGNPDFSCELFRKERQYNYSPTGTLTAKLDEEGLVTLYEYNLADKLTKTSYADGKTVRLKYNPLQQLTQMQDWLGTTTLALDALGRPISITDHQGKQTQYTWNALGQKATQTYPDGSQVDYSYNASGNLATVRSSEGLTHYAYDPMGRIKERLLPDGTISTYTIDPLGRIAALTHQRDNQILDQYQYTYDPVSNITQIEKYRRGIAEDNGIYRYLYNPLNQLSMAIKGIKKTIYQYDELGNRTE